MKGPGTHCTTALLVVGLLSIAGYARADEERPSREQIERRLAELDAERARLREQLDEQLNTQQQIATQPTTAGDVDPTAKSDRSQAAPAVGPALAREMIVVARRRPGDARRATPSIITFGRSDLVRRQSSHVADVLQEAPGVYVVSDGPRGQFTRVFTRGAGSTQTLVLVDGIPQNDATTGGGFDFNDLTASGIERVEVLKGSYGVLYGSEAIGGVINVVTRRGRGDPGGFVRFEAGSFDTHREVLGFGGASDRGDFSITVENAGAHGERKNEDYSQHGVTGRFGLDVSDELRAEVSLRFADSQVDSPFDFASSGVLPLDSNIHRTRETFSTGVSLTWEANDWLSLQLTGSALGVDSSFNNGPDGTTTIDPDFTPGSGDEFSVVQDELRTLNEQTDLRGRLSATADIGTALELESVDDGGLGVELTVGGEYLDQDSRSVVTFPDFNAATSTTTDAHHVTTTDSLFAQFDLALPEIGPFDQAVLTFGTRRDEHSVFGSETSPFIGARVAIPGTGIRLRAARGEGFRAPKPAELFDGFSGNLDLAPETSRSFDIGGEIDLLDGDVTLGVTWFDLEVDDLIAYSSTDTTPSRPFGRLVNLDRTRTRGFEYSARADLGQGFTARASMTVQNPRNERTGAVLPLRAKHFGSAGVSWTNGTWSVSADAFISGHLDNVGGTVTYPEPRERSRPGRRKVLKLTARYVASDTLTWFGRIENLLDDDYVTTPTAPAGAPFGVFLGAELKF